MLVTIFQTLIRCAPKTPHIWDLWIKGKYFVRGRLICNKKGEHKNIAIHQNACSNIRFLCMDHPPMNGKSVPMYWWTIHRRYCPYIRGWSIHRRGSKAIERSDVWIEHSNVWIECSDVWIQRSDEPYIGAPIYGCWGTLQWLPTWVFLRLPRCLSMATFIRSPLVAEAAWNLKTVRDNNHDLTTFSVYTKRIDFL